VRFGIVAFCLAGAVALAGCGDGASTSSGPPDGSIVDPSERLPGGDVTVARDDVQAFSERAPALDFAGEANFKSGDLLFRAVPRGAGPLFNTRSCQGCHLKDGRGSPPASPDEPLDALLLRLSVGEGSDPDPIYGDQLQGLGVAGSGEPRHDGALPRPDAPYGDGAIGEAFAYIETEATPGQYGDGTPWVLLRPVYKLRDLSYGPFSPDLRLSPRMAPPMFGLGLVEAIPEEDILALEDPDDRDRDGISGRANFVHDILRNEMRLGRFGWKASQPSILQQAAGAYNGDVGATNAIFPVESCTAAQPGCSDQSLREPNSNPGGVGATNAIFPVESCTAAQPGCSDQSLREPNSNPGGVDVSLLELALVEFYSRHLAVPRRRGWNSETKTWSPEIQRGRELFFAANCVGCHVPKHETGVAEGSLLGDVDLNSLEQPSTPRKELSDQTIWPYTDLLLHDMGGECAPLARETAAGAPCSEGPECLWVQRCEGLADGRPDLFASGSEWRTPPLWGLGLARVVNPTAAYLHDGRARTIEEAILWHGGEAEASRRFFVELSADERSAVLAFLESQ